MDSYFKPLFKTSAENDLLTTTFKIDNHIFDNFFCVRSKEKAIDLPERYIINEHVCVCHWKDGTVTKSYKHEQDKFNKKIGFLLCYFRHVTADKSNNKRKKMLSWIKFECLEECLFDMFVEKTGMTFKQAEAYIRDLKVEEKESKTTKKFKINNLKVGDEILHENYGKGKIVEYEDDESFCVEFDIASNLFHSNNGKGKEEHCYWIDNSELLEKEEKDERN